MTWYDGRDPRHRSFPLVVGLRGPWLVGRGLRTIKFWDVSWPLTFVFRYLSFPGPPLQLLFLRRIWTQFRRVYRIMWEEGPPAIPVFVYNFSLPRDPCFWPAFDRRGRTPASAFFPSFEKLL